MEKDKIKKYKENLYSRTYHKNEDDLKKLRELRVTDTEEIKNDWGSVKKRLDRNRDLYKYEEKTNIFTIIFFIALTFFVLASAAAFFFLYFQKNSVPLNQMEMTLTSPNSIDSGDVLKYNFTLENNTDYDFNNVEVFVKYPKASVSPITNSTEEREDFEVKDILAGGSKKIKKTIIFSGSPGDKKKIEIGVNYQIKGYSAILHQKKEFFVKIDSSPVFVKVNVPKSIMSKENFNMDIEVSSNASMPLKNLVLIGKYPNGFEIVDSTPAAIYSTNKKNIFRIDSLKVGEKKDIKIVARLVGENSEEKVVLFIVGDTNGMNDEIRTKFFDTKEKIIIKKPSLDLKLFCDGDTKSSDNIFVNAGDKLKCKFKLNNNLATKVTDVNLKMSYDDKLLDEYGIKSAGSYVDSNNNDILWNKETFEGFKVMKGFSSVSAGFELPIIKLKQLAGYVKNPEMDLKFKIEGVNFSKDAAIGNVHNEIVKKLKFNTNIILESGTTYDSSPFQNFGGPTPEVGKETTYTITWKIYNSTNRIQDVIVKAKLPLGVEFKNIVSPEKYYLTYNKETREVKWSIKSIEPFIGYRTDPKTVSFQVGYIPVLSDVGGYKVLVEKQSLTAKDSFTGNYLQTFADPDTTRMYGEKGYKYNAGQVK